MDPGLRTIAVAQVERRRIAQRDIWPALASLLADAVTPEDVHAAILKERPVLGALERVAIAGPHPADLRDEAAAAGVLGASRTDRAFRRLFPTLDTGVYVANHSMGLPSIALVPAMQEAYLRLVHRGPGAWAPDGWLDAIEAWRGIVATLVGADLVRGDVAACANFSDGLWMALSGVSGRMVSDATHFTTARYIHARWAERTGSELVEVEPDDRGTVSAERIAAALTADTRVVSVSHACWKNGYLLDVDVIADAIADRCPDAVLIVDVYQTQGTVPLDTRRFPLRSAIIGGGIKQMHAGPGAGFAWISHPLLAELVPERPGWWAHRDPLAFDPSFDEAPGAVRLRSGTLDPMPLIALTTEARVLASSASGDLRAAIARARAVTQANLLAAARLAEELGLTVAGARHPSRRAAFFAIPVEDGPAALAALGRDGVIADLRSDGPGQTSGLIRMSSSAASFAYELEFAVERLARAVRHA